MALSRVVTDDAGAITAAMAMLSRLGHRTVGRVTGPADLVHTAARDATMRASGDPLHMAVRIVEADYSADAGRRAARRLLAGTPAPTAIVFDDDVRRGSTGPALLS